MPFFSAQRAAKFLPVETRSSETLQIALAAVCGAGVGLVVALVQQAIFALHQGLFLLPEGYRLSVGYGVSPLRMIAIPALGGLALGGTTYLLQRARKTEIVDPIEANALHGGRMSLIDSLRLFFATILSNISGASVGMEAGYSQYGSGVFSACGQKFNLRRADLRIFVAAGSAAAIAAAYNAPLAGAFYGFELILGTYSLRALTPVMVASLAGVLIERILISPEPAFATVGAFHFSSEMYLLFALVGIAASGVCVLAMRAVHWAELAFRLLPVPKCARPIVGGALLSAMALYVPQILGSGHGAIQFQLDHHWPLLALAILLAAKLIASAVSIGSGFRGGLFLSSLFLGCVFGGVFADLAEAVVPALGGQHTALVIVGMGAVAAGIVGAPLTMVFLVLEGTGDFSMTAGVTVGVIVTSTIVRMSFGYSFSTWRFHLRGLKIHGAHDIGWLKELTVEKLLRADAKTLEGSVAAAEARGRYPLGSAKRIFVTDAAGRYLGLLDLNRFYEAADESTPIAELVVSADAFLLPQDDIKTALHRFETFRMEALPVVRSAAERVVVGYVTEAYALRRYSEMLERRRSAELGQSDLYAIGDTRMP